MCRVSKISRSARDDTSADMQLHDVHSDAHAHVRHVGLVEVQLPLPRQRLAVPQREDAAVAAVLLLRDVLRGSRRVCSCSSSVYGNG